MITNARSVERMKLLRTDFTMKASMNALAKLAMASWGA